MTDTSQSSESLEDAVLFHLHGATRVCLMGEVQSFEAFSNKQCVRACYPCNAGPAWQCCANSGR